MARTVPLATTRPDPLLAVRGRGGRRHSALPSRSAFRWLGGRRAASHPTDASDWASTYNHGLAKTADLKSLLAVAPEPNRLVLGRWDRRRLLMTEPSEAFVVGRGVRGAVAVFGPSQSGKTTGLILGINEWVGPAIVSSVKTDLLHRTIEARSAVGEVKVFDPIGISGLPHRDVEPAAFGRDVGGSARRRSTAGQPNERRRTRPTSSGEDKREQLIAGMLWVAANTDGLHDGHVVEWVTTPRQPDDAGPGTLSPLVRLADRARATRIAADAKKVQG